MPDSPRESQKRHLSKIRPHGLVVDDHPRCCSSARTRLSSHRVRTRRRSPRPPRRWQCRHSRRSLGRACDPHQPSFCDAEARGRTMTDVFALFGRGVFLTAPLTNSSSSACLPTSRSSAAIRASIAQEDPPRPRLRQRSRPRASEPRPGSGFDRYRDAWRARAGSRRPEFLSDLALEFDAVRAVLGYGLPSFESPGSMVNSCWSKRPAQGATPEAPRRRRAPHP